MNKQKHADFLTLQKWAKQKIEQFTFSTILR